jgi:sulfite reductase alpha subunit-like flavoprotein
MEAGVLDALRGACTDHGMDWDALQPLLRDEGRLHFETY